MKWLLLDIGGVLVKLAGVPKVMEWTNGRMNTENLGPAWLFSKAVRAYETGRISTEEFAAGVIEEFGFPVTAEEFMKEFVFFMGGLFPGAEDLLRKLTGRYPTATLSNANELHWKALCADHGFDSIVKRNFLSFQIGFMKPDKEAFEKVIKGLGCEPGEILFFDDSPQNVEGARAAGMQAVHVTGFEDFRNKVFEFGLLDKNECGGELT